MTTAGFPISKADMDSFLKKLSEQPPTAVIEETSRMITRTNMMKEREMNRMHDEVVSEVERMRRVNNKEEIFKRLINK